MYCEKKKVCYLCEGTFKMERGCNLEKRCPACRFLGIQKSAGKPWKLVRDRVLQTGDGFSKYISYCAPDQNYILQEIVERNPNHTFASEYARDPFDDVLLEESNKALVEILSVLTYNEEYVIQKLIMENEETDIAVQELGLTRGRVRQILNSATKKLKHPKNARAMKEAVKYGEMQLGGVSERPSTFPVRKNRQSTTFHAPPNIVRKMGPNQDLLANWVR